MKNISHMIFLFRKYSFPAVIILLPLLFLSCGEELTVQPYSLNTPVSPSLINRSVLVSGNDYSVGYLNGNIQSEKITLTWSAAGDQDFLCIKLFRDGTELKSFLQPGSGSYTDSLIQQNRYYKYSLAIINKNGTHKQDTITIKSPRFEAPEINFTVLPDSGVKLFWYRTAESATSYLIEKSLNSANFDSLTTAYDTFYVDNSVVNGASYYYRITAKNDFEKTYASIPVMVTIFYTMNAPYLQPLQQIEGPAVQMYWDDNSTGEAGFKIFRRSGSAGNYQMIKNLPSGSTSFADADTNVLHAGDTLYYYVQGYNQKDTTAWSNVRNIIISSSAASLNEGFESGSIPSLWITGGNSSWFISADNPYAGNYSAKSGSISGNESSTIMRTLSFTGSKTISFYYRVSSESGYDRLTFYINSNVYMSESGESGWQHFSTFYFGNGDVNLMWTYRKDGSGTSGSDAAWIDNVVVK